jgi:CheY-like chemotaxis protein
VVAPPSGERVLIVDDDRRIGELIVETLEGYAVETASTYEAARAKLAAGGYAVAVLDVMGVRGFELLEEFAATVPCIMLTARALKPHDLERAIAARAALFLPKEEVAFLDDYIARVREAAATREPLWPWLFERVDFRRWLGPGWTPPRGAAGAP